MIDESKLIFFTGIPGSKWSTVAHIISHNKKYPINISDYSPERQYTHSQSNGIVGLSNGISHQGAYFGPGNTFGNNFDQLDKLSKEEVLEELDKPYSDKSWDTYRIIKCHQFGLHLDFIKDTFPTSKIIMVMRPEPLAYSAWLKAGGFDLITYPNYQQYYQNEDKLKKELYIESAKTKQFVHEQKLKIDVVSQQYWNSAWNLSANDSQELERYMNSIETKLFENGTTAYTYDVTIASVNL